MRQLIILFFGAVFSTATFSQTEIGVEDNFFPLSNTDYVITPGEYEVRDVADDGVMQIINKSNITIDGTDVIITGLDSTGYFLNIENSHDITITNFERVSGYYYVIRALNCQSITIDGNDFSYNKKDTVGWIVIRSTVDQALGGGVLLDNTIDSEIMNNTMTQQNDGVALYECENIHIHNNVLNWNCGFGIRMNWTDRCHIHHNDCSHVNRLTDPSDCAALLVLYSTNNQIEYNNLSYSGDGVFLSMYEHHEIPCNNTIIYNNCSYSPHNAIEATFADGNVFNYNECNFSHYGFWLGYSFNSHVEGNEIIGNLTAGLAIDRGFENTFIDNEIKQNPYGFQLWEGGVIDPYGDQWSHDYQIIDNTIEGNMWGIHALGTEHLVATDNRFIHNQKADLYLEGDSYNDTITRNVFNAPTGYFIQAMTEDEINAVDNQFNPADRELIHRKMRGSVNFIPFVEGPAPKFMYQPPCDMAEPNAVWTIYADPGYGHRRDETLIFDSTDFKVGYASVKLNTPRGWDVGINYRPGGDSIPMWSLTEDDTLKFWIKTIKNPNYGFQGFFIRIGNYDQGYYQYDIPAQDLNGAHNRWRHYNMPLKGTSKFVRSQEGYMDFDLVNYVEFHADTWDFGYTLWVDGVQFKDCTPLSVADVPYPKEIEMQLFPNPVSESVTIRFSSRQEATLQLFDVMGNLIWSETLSEQSGVPIEIIRDISGLRHGPYAVRLLSGGRITQQLFIKQ